MIDDAKKLYDINQWMKGASPYVYDFQENVFIGYDGQSEIQVAPSDFKLKNPTKKRFLVIREGKTLYQFLGEKKKGVKGALPAELTDKAIVVSDESYPVEYSDKLPYDSLLHDVPVETLQELDCSRVQLYYDGNLVKKGDVLIGDIIEVLANKKKVVENEFLFLELSGSKILIYESKLGLSLRNKTLICLDKFFSPKTKKKDQASEFLHLHTGPERLYVHYGNSEMDVIYKFHIFELNLETKE